MESIPDQLKKPFFGFKLNLRRLKRVIVGEGHQQVEGTTFIGRIRRSLESAAPGKPILLIDRSGSDILDWLLLDVLEFLLNSFNRHY